MTDFQYDKNGPWIEKDPDAVKNYSIDWNVEGQSVIGDDIIIDADWIVSEGLQIYSKLFSETITTIWIGGGTLGTNYLLTSRIETESGQRDDRSFTLRIVNK